MSSARQWHGRRRQDEEDDDESSNSNQDSSSASREQNSSMTGYESRKGSSAGVGPPPTYNGNRGAGIFEEYRVRAKLWLHTTPLDSRARGPRLLQALTDKAFESCRHLIDDQDWLDSPDNGTKLLELLNQPEYFGKEELESLYHSMNKLFYEELRKADDDLASFRSRFEEAVRKLRRHKIELPSEALGFLFLRQSKISSESMERLITLTGGDLKFDTVVDGLRKLKMRLFNDTSDTAGKKKQLWLNEPYEESITDPSHEPTEGIPGKKSLT